MEIRIGTRGSPLALAQTEIVRQALVGSGMVDPDGIAVTIIRTSGDRIQDRSLADIGGKGLFTKEIEEALTDGRIDLAVHSLKDLPAWLPDGLALAGVLKRADPRDALLAREARSLAELPAGARVGTSSPRRRALLLNRRPDLEIVELRGNVGTRLAKLESGAVDATLLAMAGLERLGIDAVRVPIDPADMLPAAGQGAIGIEIRADDARAEALCRAISDADSVTALAAERAFLAVIDGSCRTPIAALARVDGGVVALDALVASRDGATVLRRKESAGRADAVALGRALGEALKAALPERFFEEA